MDTTEKLIAKFYNGDISQRELARLFEIFLGSPGARAQWPGEADVIIPLALARKDAQTLREQKKPRGQKHWRAAAAVLVLLMACSATVFAVEQRSCVYSTEADCDWACAESWLNNTLENAI